MRELAQRKMPFACAGFFHPLRRSWTSSSMSARSSSSGSLPIEPSAETSLHWRHSAHDKSSQAYRFPCDPSRPRHDRFRIGRLSPGAGRRSPAIFERRDREADRASHSVRRRRFGDRLDHRNRIQQPHPFGIRGG